jgi:uncharacterized membrane protein YccF (DUF307 family)
VAPTALKQAIAISPKLIATASKTPLGIIALIIIAYSLLAYFLFSSSADNTKIIGFTIALLAVGLTAVSLLPLFRVVLDAETQSKASRAKPDANIDLSKIEKELSKLKAVIDSMGHEEWRA